jgi:glycosyltransferase involved in cell wall biosynthesis
MARFVGDAQARLDFIRKVFAAADMVIAPSHFLKRMFVQNGYRAESIQVSPYGLDLSWGPQPAPRPSDGVLTIGYLGQLEPLKGVDILVRAIRLLPPQAPVRLRIHGALDKNPPYVQSLRDIALGDPRIEFAGVYTRPQLGAVLANMDVIAVPSVWYENTPLVIGEAFAAGRPALATNLGGMSEAVQHDINGLLFERGDVAGLARAIQRLLDEPGLLNRLRAGIGPVRTIDDEMVQLLQIYGGTPTDARA